MAAAAATAVAAERAPRPPSLPRGAQVVAQRVERLLARLMSRLKFVPSAPEPGSVLGSCARWSYEQSFGSCTT